MIRTTHPNRNFSSLNIKKNDYEVSLKYLEGCLNIFLKNEISKNSLLKDHETRDCKIKSI